MATEVREIVMAGPGDRDLTKLAEYEAIGGYQSLQKARGMTPAAIIDELNASELRGRGGAFFPTGRKWSFVPKPDQNPNPHYLVVNADESEPGSFNNVETMATVPPIITMGGAEYAKLGVPDSRGTRLVSLSGHVANGGNYEIENGVSLRDLIYDLGGGVPGGRQLKAVIPGGSSTSILRYDEIDVGYDFNSLLKLDTAMGSAGVIVLDDRCCMVQLGIRVNEFYEHESCGKCTPCREGTRWMSQILKRLEAGDAEQHELDLLLDVCDRINGKCLCPLGETAAIAVASYVAKFRDEFQAHIDEGGCPFGDSSPLHAVLAPVAQHTLHPTATVPA